MEEEMKFYNWILRYSVFFDLISLSVGSFFTEHSVGVLSFCFYLALPFRICVCILSRCSQANRGEEILPLLPSSLFLLPVSHRFFFSFFFSFLALHSDMPSY